jgi:hypothetical protein
LRAAASTERVDAHALGRHLAEDRPIHRDEERECGGVRGDRGTTEAAPSSP